MTGNPMTWRVLTCRFTEKSGNKRLSRAFDSIIPFESRTNQNYVTPSGVNARLYLSKNLLLNKCCLKFVFGWSAKINSFKLVFASTTRQWILCFCNSKFDQRIPEKKNPAVFSPNFGSLYMGHPFSKFCTLTRVGGWKIWPLKISLKEKKGWVKK